MTTSAKIKSVKPLLNSTAIDALNIITIGANPKTINMIDMILIILNEFVGIFFKLISPFYFFNQINWNKKLPQMSIDKALPNGSAITTAITANVAKIISFKTISSPFCIVICWNFFKLIFPFYVNYF